MKKDWKDLEGKGLRVDVGSTSSQAMSDSTPAEVLCFTTDGKIILNGVEFAPQANLIEDAINAEHPYVMSAVETENYSGSTPQILLDTSDCEQTDIDAFFEEYPLSDIVDCINKGRQIYALRKTRSYSHYTKMEVLSHLQSATMHEIKLRWYYGKYYYITTLTNKSGKVTLDKVKQISDTYLQEQINEIKKLLQLA